MKEMTCLEFMQNLPSVLTDVLDSGDIVRVEALDKRAFVVMEEPEYLVMRDALAAIFAGSVKPKQR